MSILPNIISFLASQALIIWIPFLEKPATHSGGKFTEEVLRTCSSGMSITSLIIIHPSLPNVSLLLKFGLLPLLPALCNHRKNLGYPSYLQQLS